MKHYLINLQILFVLLGFILLRISAVGSSNSSKSNALKSPEFYLGELFKKYTVDNTLNSDELQKFLDNLRNPSGKLRESRCFTAQDILTGSVNASGLQRLMPTILFDLDENVCHIEHQGELEITPHYDWRVWSASIGAVLVISVSGLIVVALVPLMSRHFYNVVTQFLIALSVGSLIGDAFLHLIPHALLSHGDSNFHGHSHSEVESGGDSMKEHDNFVWKSLIILLGIYSFFITERLTIFCQNRASSKKMKRHQAKIMPPNSSGHAPSSPKHLLDSDTNKLDGTDPSVKQPIKQHARSHMDGDCELNFESTNMNKNQDELQQSFNQNLSNVCGGESVPNNMNCDAGGIGTSASNSSAMSQICNRPPTRPLDNARCIEFLQANINEGVMGEGHDGSCSLASPTKPSEHDARKGVWTLDMGGDNNSSEDEDEEVDKTSDTLHDPTSIHRGNRKSNNSGDKINNQMTHDGHNHHHHHHHSHFPQAFPHRKKPHGHHHGHSHDLSSVKAIAYTIIAGDGLHNFCDGIAIGASFSESLQGGLSTALAVLCHELPHELGDFAVLLHAGMSVKAALFYNTLSSVLCAAGMVLGVLLGSLPSVNAWLFLLTAGMFVYIALVDMMPELATNRLGGYRRCHMPSVLFFWQNMGMLIGFGIMFIIARLEGTF